VWGHGTPARPHKHWGRIFQKPREKSVNDKGKKGFDMSMDDINAEIAARARVDAIKPYLPGLSGLLTDELVSAVRKHGCINSAYEGYAVILKEVEELWDEIKKRREIRDPNRLKGEAIQVAAMALRFIIDVIERGGRV